jgi:RimJ/RimL family protein N-acetyltransferase
MDRTEHAGEALDRVSELRADAALAARQLRRLAARDAAVTLSPLTAESIAAATVWLNEPANYKWLDFGAGRQQLSPTALHYMSRSGAHYIRACHDATGRLVGIAGLQHVDSKFKSAMLWGVRPRLRPPTRSNAANQIRSVLEVAFTELGLVSVYAWVVAINLPSIAAVRAAGMTEMGRQRRAHLLDGMFQDRLLFDILGTEFHAQEATLRAWRHADPTAEN